MQCSVVQWGDSFIGCGNLTRSNFDHSENYLVGGMTLCWCGDGGDKHLMGGMSKCLANGGGGIPPVGKTLDRGSQGGYIILSTKV